MTTYTELAKSPLAFDTELAELHTKLAQGQNFLRTSMHDVHRAAGGRRVSTRHGVRWSNSYDEAHAKVRESCDPNGLLVQVSIARHQVTETQLEIQAMDEAYTGWTRYFPSDTKSHPHIHRSLYCRTLHPTTVMRWAPELSGHTDAEAVDKLDEALCSVCFPGAPVALHNYVSRRSQAEQAERQAAKDDRAAKALAKNLDGGEIFRSRRHDRITTVAACKELVRKAIELAVEVEWYSTHNPGYDADQIVQVRANRARSLAEAEADANTAAATLEAREARHEGWGADADAIAKMRASKLKSARREWAK